MYNTLHQHLLTRELKDLSARLDDLIQEVRRYETQALPPELLDELASTTGELMLLLVDHRSVYPADAVTRRAMADAQQLRLAARSSDLDREQLAQAAATLWQEIEQIVKSDKQAA